MSVFISYAKEDTAKAQEIFIALKKRGLDPWMDKPPNPYQGEGILPGENWRDRLEREIRRADRVILLLSQTSIAKVGYVQREFRSALDIMNSMPPNARFVVPLLIDDCEPPNLVVDRISLADLHWSSLDELGLETFMDILAADMAA